jgi:hypothetical protein
MRLTLYFHEHTKGYRGAMDVHIIKTHDGIVKLDSKLRGDPQSIIETVEAIWGPDWHDGYWESRCETA